MKNLFFQAVGSIVGGRSDQSEEAASNVIEHNNLEWRTWRETSVEEIVQVVSHMKVSTTVDAVTRDYSITMLM